MIAPPVAASTPIRPATTIITATTIVTATAVGTAAPVHAVAAARPTVLALVENPVSPLPLGDLLTNRLYIEPPLLKLGATPLDLTRQVG